MTKQQRWTIRLVTIFYVCYMSFFASRFQFMALNVFLAYLPIELSFHLEEVGHKLFLGLSFLWLLFYPNAPYLLTDFFHLEALAIYQKNSELFSDSLQDWWSFSLLVVGIIPYYFLGTQSMVQVMGEWQKRSPVWKRLATPILMLMLHFLASLAIFVGRFNRFHSIHLFMKPIETIQLIFFDWTMNKWLFVCMFTALQSLLMFLLCGCCGAEKEK